MPFLSNNFRTVEILPINKNNNNINNPFYLNTISITA